MRNIVFITLIVVFCIGLFSYAANEDFDKQVRKIHEKAIVVDAHAHSVLHSKRSMEHINLGIDNPYSQIDFIKMKNGEVDAVFYALPIIIDENVKNPSKLIFNSFKVIKDAIDRYHDLAGIATSVDDIKKLNALGKRAILITIEFPDFMEGCIELLEVYQKMGAASFVLSELDGISAKKNDAGGDYAVLSNLGIDAVKRMNELGVMIDISHLPDSLQNEVLKISSRPVIASHSNARGVNDVPRNIPDDIIKTIASKGGAVMVTFYPGHISHEYYLAREEYRKKEKELKEQFKENEKELEQKLNETWDKLQPESVNMEKLIDHIDYIVKLVGPDHVGIGSDFGGDTTPKGLETAAQYPNITAELLKRGYSEEDIIKILGGNLLRILDEVQSKVK